MDLLTNYSDLNEILYTDFFLKSEVSEYNILTKKLNQKCKTGFYMSDGWSDITKDKIISIYEYINDTNKDVFLYSDVDVLLLKKTKNYLLQLLSESGLDILFQSDIQELNLSYMYNTGFFICNVNDKTKNLFEFISKKTFEKNEDDQVVLNNVIKNFDIKVGCLPKLIYNYNFWRLDNETYKDKINWTDDIFFEIPDDTLVFHANWTVGIDNKIKLLNNVINQSKIKCTL